MTTEDIKAAILACIPDAKVFVVDPYRDGEHFQALVISHSFEGQMLVKQHQLVMNALKEAFAGQVHALSLKTYTPSKWKKDKHLFNVKVEQ